MVEESPPRRELLVSKGWVQASIVVFLIGFFVLGLLAYRTYSADPPIPDRVVDPAGADGVHRRGHQRGPEDLPQQRADGVRLDLRPRRLPRPRLHRRLPAPGRATRSSASTAARAPTARASGRSPTSRRTATTSRPTRSPTPRRRRTPSRSSSATTPTSSPNPTTEQGLRPDAIDDPDAGARADRVLLAGPPGRPRPAGPGTTTPTRTTGRPRSWSTTARPRTSCSGASSR